MQKRIKQFIKNDWEKTHKSIFYRAPILALLIWTASYNLFKGIWVNEAYFSAFIWNTGYLMIWMLFELIYDLNREWRKLFRDAMKMNDDLLDSQIRLFSEVNQEIIDEKERQKNGKKQNIS